MSGCNPGSTLIRYSDIASRQNLIDYSAMHVGQAEIAALEFVGQAFVVDAEQVQHGRPQPWYSNEPVVRRDFWACRIESFLPRIECPNFRREIGCVAGHDREVVVQSRGRQQAVNDGPATALSFVCSTQLSPSFQNFAAQWQ